MNEPIIVTSWDQMPPNVIGDGIEYSTRILCKQYNDAKENIAKLEADKKDLQAKLAELSNSTLGRIADLELALGEISALPGERLDEVGSIAMAALDKDQ